MSEERRKFIVVQCSSSCCFYQPAVLKIQFQWWWRMCVCRINTFIMCTSSLSGQMHTHTRERGERESRGEKPSFMTIFFNHACITKLFMLIYSSSIAKYFYSFRSHHVDDDDETLYWALVCESLTLSYDLHFWLSTIRCFLIIKSVDSDSICLEKICSCAQRAKSLAAVPFYEQLFTAACCCLNIVLLNFDALSCYSSLATVFSCFMLLLDAALCC